MAAQPGRRAWLGPQHHDCASEGDDDDGDEDDDDDRHMPGRIGLLTVQGIPLSQVCRVYRALATASGNCESKRHLFEGARRTCRVCRAAWQVPRCHAVSIWLGRAAGAKSTLLEGICRMSGMPGLLGRRGLVETQGRPVFRKGLPLNQFGSFLSQFWERVRSLPLVLSPAAVRKRVVESFLRPPAPKLNCFFQPRKPRRGREADSRTMM